MTKYECMEAYLKVIQKLTKQFEKFELTIILRGEDTSTNALTVLAWTSDPPVKKSNTCRGDQKSNIDIALKSLNIYEIEFDHNMDEPNTDVKLDPNVNDLEQDDFAELP